MTGWHLTSRLGQLGQLECKDIAGAGIFTPEPLQSLERMFSTHPWTLLHGDGAVAAMGTPLKRPTPCTLIFATPHALNRSRFSTETSATPYSDLFQPPSGTKSTPDSGTHGIVLLDLPGMRERLCSELAAEFGSRVILESTAPEVNG